MLKKAFAFDNYKKFLDNGFIVYREQMLFQNKKHEILTSKINKFALNQDDDKRLIQAD